jgi:hypothetical protein
MKSEYLDLNKILKTPDLFSLLSFENDFELIKEVAKHNVELFSKIKINYDKDLKYVKEILNINPKIIKYINVELKYLEKLIEFEPYILLYLYEPSDYYIYLGAKKDASILNQFYYRQIDEKYLIKLVENDGMILKFISPFNQTNNIVESAIKNNYKSYKYASIKNIKFDLYVLEKDIKMIPYTSGPKFETIDYYIEYSVDYFPELYKKYPKYFDENKLKSIIVRKLDFIKLIKNPTDELKLLVLNSDPDFYFKHFKYEQNFLKNAIEQNGLLIKYLKKKDLKTIIKAVKNNVLSLDYIENKRKYILDLAIKINGLAIKYIENPTQEMYETAIKSNPYAIKYIPYEKQTEKMQIYVVNQLKEESINYITPLNDNVLKEILKIVPSYIFKIENPNKEMFKIVFSETGQLMISFDDWEKRFDDELKLMALSNDGSILKYFNNQTINEVKTAIQSYPYALQWAKIQNEDIILEAINLNPKALYYADRSKITEKILDKVLEIDPDYFKKEKGEMTFEEWKKHISEIKQQGDK